MKRILNAAFLLKLAVLAACLLSFVESADAQRRRTPTRRAAKPAATTPAPAVNTAEIKAGAEKVSTQIKNVTKFVYLLGGIATGIEDVDKDAKASRVALDQNAKNKQAVVTTLRNLRAGLAALEIEFRTKPALRPYLTHIDGIAEMTGAAEDQVLNGRLTDSGKTLLVVVERLSDALVAMP